MKRTDDLILPSGRIITPKLNKKKRKEQGIPVERVKGKTDFSEEKEYNKNINDHPEYLLNLRVKPNYILVRRFKYDRVPMSEGGLILETPELYETPGGQLKAKVKSQTFRKQGVIVNAGSMPDNDYYKLFVRGAMVNLESHDYKHYHVDRSLPVNREYLGEYILVHTAAVECIVPNGEY